MSLMVTLFVVAFFTQSWTAPQWRNWTPQAVLYLKGAQRHRSVLERANRDRDDTLHLVTHSQNGDGLGLSWASLILLELLQRRVDKGGYKLDDYPDEQAPNLKYL
nr:spexin prohormone 1-like [Solea senegalensis]